jgi:TRAP-type mannitol/chloroaromatic compound transport system permease small subunit
MQLHTLRNENKHVQEP